MARVGDLVTDPTHTFSHGADANNMVVHMTLPGTDPWQN